MSPASASSPSPEATDLRPTVVRYKVVGFAASLAIITYIDRVCIAQAAPLIRKDLGLDTVQMAWAFSAFAWAYAVFEIPGGWMGDRFGARKALTRVVVWWSIFTAATGWVKNWVSLIATRTLFGAGEAGCFPNLTRAFSAWLPPQERVRAQGLLWLSARWAGAFTPLLVVLMLDYFTWRQVFEIFGAIGIAWAVVFWFWYRDKPGAHKGVNAAELALLRDAQPELAQGPIPWRRFLQSRTVWLLWAQYFCLNYGWAFYITWLPTYLTEARGVGLKQGGLLAGIPLFFGGIGSLATGYVSMPLARWDGRHGAVAPHSGNVRLRRRRNRNMALPSHHRSHPRDGGARDLKLRQRSRHADKLGNMHGRRWALCGDTFRKHEYDRGGQCRSCADDGGLSPQVERSGLAAHVLRIRGRLPARNDLVDLHRLDDAARPVDGFRISGRPGRRKITRD